MPQTAQLIEHECRITALLRTEPLLERAQHFLHALGGAFLLLDAVLEAEDFVLQLAVRLLELGAILEKRHDAPVVFGGFVPDEKAA